MKWLLVYIFSLFSLFSFGQNFAGSWSGLIKFSGEKWENANIIYFSLSKENGQFSGLSRIELFKELDKFSVKTIVGKRTDGKLKLTESFVKRSSHSRNTPNCKLIYSLSFNDSTGYLSGTFESSDCRHGIGEIVLFRSNHKVNDEIEPTSTHLWAHRFLKNYLRGFPAPAILKKEQEQFKFKPIYFDFDKAEIRPQYYSYLTQMARIVMSMDDLRILITGNTDAFGTDAYNMDLSEKRADALRNFFERQGVNSNKLEIDFKGERNPVATNSTSDGRQSNRRVNFAFDYK